MANPEQEKDRIREQYRELQDVKARLEGLDGSLAAQLREEADSRFDTALGAASDESQVYFVEQLTDYETSAEELETARETLSKRSIPVPEELEQSLERLKEAERDGTLDIGKRILRLSGEAGKVLGVVTDVEPVAEPSELAIKPETTKHNEIRIGFGEDDKGLFVRIARRRVYMFPSGKPYAGGSRGKDYSVERIAALKVLVDTKEELLVGDLWDKMCAIMGVSQGAGQDESNEARNRAMGAARKFFESDLLMYRGKPLVIHNGIRGTYSRYRVNPDINGTPVFDLSDDEIKDLYLRLNQDIQDTSEPILHLEEAEDEPFEAPEIDLSQEKIEEANAEIPTIRELASLLVLFRDHSEGYTRLIQLLVDEEQTALHNILELANNSTNDILRLLNESDDFADEAVDSKTLRAQAFTKINRALNDVELLNNVYSVIEDMSGDEYSAILDDLYSAFLDLSDGEWQTLHELIEQTVFISTVTDPGGRRGGQLGDMTPGAYVGERYFDLSEPIVSEERDDLMDEADKQDDGTSQSVQESVVVSAHDSQDNVITSLLDRLDERAGDDNTTDLEQSDQDTQPEKSEAEIKFETDLAKAVVELSSEHVLREETISSKQLSRMARSGKLGTRQSLKRLRQMGIIGHDKEKSGNLNAVEIVASHMLNTHRKMLTGGTKSPGYKMIEKAVEKYFADQKRTNGGQAS